MSNQKADTIAVSRLETRIDPRAEVVPVKPPVPCNWDNCEVIPLKQDSPLDTRELLFVGLTSSTMDPGALPLKAISTQRVASPSKGDKYLS